MAHSFGGAAAGGGKGDVEKEFLDDAMALSEGSGFVIWGNDVDFNAVSYEAELACAHAWVNDAHFLGEGEENNALFDTAPVAHAECYFPSHASAQAVEIASFVFSSESSAAGGAEIVKAEAEAVATADRSPRRHRHQPSSSFFHGGEDDDDFSLLSFDCDAKKASVPKAIALAEDKEEEEMKEELELHQLLLQQQLLDEEVKKKESNRHRAAKYWRWKKQFPSNKTLNVARVAATALRLRVNGKFQKKQKKQKQALVPKQAKVLAKKGGKRAVKSDHTHPLNVFDSLTMGK